MSERQARPVPGRAKSRDPDGDADAVERDVQRRGVAALDEVLVDLVGDGVRDARDEGGQLATERAEEQGAEDRELRHVPGLAEHRVPRSEARRRGSGSRTA